MPIKRYSSTDLSRHPIQLFMLGLCFLASAPTLLGAIPPPASIEASLPIELVRGWSGLLFFGAAIALVGVYWRNRVTGIIIEQVGFIWLGLAAVVYSAAIGKVVGVDNGAGVNIAMIFGFAMAAFWRAGQIQSDLNELHRLQKIHQADEAEGD